MSKPIEEKILRARAKQVLYEVNPLAIVPENTIEQYYRFLLTLFLSGQIELPSEESVRNYLEREE